MVQAEQLALRRDMRAKPYAALRDAMIAARKNAGMSQRELADHIGRPQSFVAKVEIGERCLDVVEFVAIARIIGADVPRIVAILEGQLSE